MKNIKISFLLDALFLFIAVFFVFYAFIKSLVKSIFLSTLLTVLICLVITSIYTVISIKKHGKKAVIDGDEKQFNAFLKTLSLSPDKETFALIKSYYESVGEEPIKSGDKIKLKNRKDEVFFDFTPNGATLKSVLTAYKNTSKGYKLVFIAIDYDVNAVNYFKGFENRVSLLNAKTLYLSLKEKNLLPNLNLEEVKKPTLYERFSSVFKREKAPVFLAWGGALLLFSTVSYYKALYVIVGGAFIIFSLFIRFFAKPMPTKKMVL